MNFRVLNKNNSCLGAVVYMSLAGFVFLSPTLIRFSHVAYTLSNLPYRQLDAVIFLWLSLAFIFQSFLGMFLAVFYAIFFFGRFWLSMEALVQIVFVLLLVLVMISFFRILLSRWKTVNDLGRNSSMKSILIIVFIGIFSALFLYGKTNILEVIMIDVTHKFKINEILSKKQQVSRLAGVKVVLKSGLAIDGEIIFEDTFFYTILDQKGKENIALKEEILKIESLA
jgi:hypothetical protein